MYEDKIICIIIIIIIHSSISSISIDNDGKPEELRFDSIQKIENKKNK